MADKAITYLKDKLKSRLETLKPYMNDVKYKLYIKIIEDCNSIDEIREIADLGMQVNLINYILEIDNKLKLSDTTVDELEAINNKNRGHQRYVVIEPKHKDKIVDNMSLAEIEEDLDNPEILSGMANLLMQRLQNEPLEERYSEEIALSVSIDNIEIEDEYIEDEEVEEDEEDIFDSSVEEELGYEEEGIEEEEDIFESNIEDDESIFEDDESIFEDAIDTEDIFDESIDEEDSLFEDDIEAEENDILEDDIDIDEEDIFDESIDDEDSIFDESVESEDIFEDDIESDDIFEESIESDDIFEEDIETDDIFDDDIDAEDIFEDNTDEEDIFDDSIESDDIFEEDIDAYDIFEDSTDEDDIFDEGIESDDIFDDSVESDDDIDNINPDDMFEGTYSEDYDKIIDNSIEDNIGDFNKVFNSNNKARSNQVNTKNIFKDGTKRGEQTQDMYNNLIGMLNKTMKGIRRGINAVRK